MKTETLFMFRALFENQKRSLLKGVVSEAFQLKTDDLADEVDLTSSEMEAHMQMRLRHRESLLLKKIDEALARLTAGTFGECESCEEEIDIRRLEARPTATLCVHCKEQQERTESLHIDGHKPKSVGARLRLA